MFNDIWSQVEVALMNMYYKYYISIPDPLCTACYGFWLGLFWNKLLFPQILETIPISDEVSDLVQELGTFYTEVYRDGEEAESESGVDTRPFTRPFAQQHTGTMLN